MEKVISTKLKGGKVSEVFFEPRLEKLENELVSLKESKLFVFDSNTASLFSSIPENSIILKPGEKEKKWESVDKILKKAVSLGLGRDSIFIAVGGGVICDMTAFAASVYMRGARCILVPTTLLSMVDASLGGKTGIDYEGLKNFVGTFFPAEKIIICTESLKTLSESEYINGLGEVVKHALLSEKRTLFEFLEKNHDKILKRDEKTMNDMVLISLLVKLEFIEKDPEEEKGIRSFLNLGHTFGHAYESISNYSISHGEGVVWGTIRALKAGVNKGLTSKELYTQSEKLFSLFPFRTEKPIKEEEVSEYLKALRKDKKKNKGEVNFVLLKDIGEPILIHLSDNEIVSVIS